MEGKFITLEGIEGSGKSTSLETISKRLTEEKIEFMLQKSPEEDLWTTIEKFTIK